MSGRGRVGYELHVLRWSGCLSLDSFLPPPRGFKWKMWKAVWPGIQVWNLHQLHSTKLHIFCIPLSPNTAGGWAHLIGDAPFTQDRSWAVGLKFKAGAEGERVHSFKRSSHTRPGAIGGRARPTHWPFLIVSFAAETLIPRG